MQSHCKPFECIELFLPWQVYYKYCHRSFINKPAFLNFAPPLIKKIYHVDTSCFYKFVFTIVAQAHIFLMIRLILNVWLCSEVSLSITAQ